MDDDDGQIGTCRASERRLKVRTGISRQRDVDAAADHLPAVVAGVKFQESCCLVLPSLGPAVAALDNTK